MNSIKNKFSKVDTANKFGGWVPKKIVQDFFGYGNTKMSTFAVDYNIRISKIGKRIFYNYNDIVKLLEGNIV